MDRSTNVYTAEPEFEKVQLVREVVIDALAAMRIVKHCNENLPAMVAGSLLGIDVDGVLEVTYSFAFPQPKGENDVDGPASEELDGAEYQIEMMKMLRDVNIDNNCVGWYQSMFMGTVCTNDVVTYQYSYQSSEELSENSIVIMYDAIQSRKGDIGLKAYRLSEKFMELRKSKANKFISPQDILEELPITIRTSGYSAGYLRCLQDTHADVLESDYENLSMSSTEQILEKHLELMTNWIDDLSSEQSKFQVYLKNNTKLRQEYLRWISKRINENIELRELGEDEVPIRLEEFNLKPLPEVPLRNDHLLMLAQLSKYCDQTNEQIHQQLQKVTISSHVNSTVASVASK